MEVKINLIDGSFLKTKGTEEDVMAEIARCHYDNCFLKVNGSMVRNGESYNGVIYTNPKHIVSIH